MGYFLLLVHPTCKPLMLKSINFYLMWLWSQFPEITSTFSDQQFRVTGCAVWQAHCNPAPQHHLSLSPVLSHREKQPGSATPPHQDSTSGDGPITANKPPWAWPTAYSCYSFIFETFSSHRRKVAVHTSMLARDKRLLFCATKTLL